ncbi:hypothetical protein DPMN_150234 [Dreissena polymorpha]|uniref:Uncharacterized protein n=1 Tax=Dreissena polymorpha TaxID=45954 RepID=A0A9D4FHK9_DREPO|nr:hypothetical protein DPMN_150234 [Dreissena polymorpha]
MSDARAGAICGCSGPHILGDEVVGVGLGVFHLNRMRDAPRDPHPNITTRYRAQ